MPFIQHNDSRRVDTHKDPILLAPGVIERHKRRRPLIRPGHWIGAIAAVIVLIAIWHH